MNRVEAQFQKLRQTGRKALIPYLMGGDPDLESLPRLLAVLAENGADLIEVGVPFSDPLADGPVIQSAGWRALQNGCTLPKLLEILTPVTRQLPIPVMLMLYANMIFRYGPANFFAMIAAAGVAGLIIPDLPADEAESIGKLAREYSIAVNFLVAPTSDNRRIQIAAKATTGFVYLVSVKGITGTRSQLPKELPELIAGVRAVTAMPVAVGFGIATPDQAKTVAELADGVVVGSAVVRTIAADPSGKAVGELIGSLRAAMDE